MVFFVHEGRGTLETTFGPIEYGKGDFLIVPKGVTHHFELGAGTHYYWMYESFAGDPEKSEAPTTGQFITHSRSDYRFPRSLDTRNESGRFEIVSKVGGVYTRRGRPAHRAHRERALRDTREARRRVHPPRAPHAPVRRHRLARPLSALPVRRRGRP